MRLRSGLPIVVVVMLLTVGCGRDGVESTSASGERSVDASFPWHVSMVALDNGDVAIADGFSDLGGGVVGTRVWWWKPDTGFMEVGEVPHPLASLRSWIDPGDGSARFLGVDCSATSPGPEGDEEDLLRCRDQPLKGLQVDGDGVRAASVPVTANGDVGIDVTVSGDEVLLEALDSSANDNPTAPWQLFRLDGSSWEVTPIGRDSWKLTCPAPESAFVRYPRSLVRSTDESRTVSTVRGGIVTQGATVEQIDAFLVSPVGCYAGMGALYGVAGAGLEQDYRLLAVDGRSASWVNPSPLPAPPAGGLLQPGGRDLVSLTSTNAGQQPSWELHMLDGGRWVDFGTFPSVDPPQDVMIVNSGKSVIYMSKSSGRWVVAER